MDVDPPALEHISLLGPSWARNRAAVAAAGNSKILEEEHGTEI